MNLPSNASPDSSVAAFWQQARQYAPRIRQLRAVAHTRAQAAPGEVWLTQSPDVADAKPAEPLTVLLLERFDGEDGDPTVFTTAPIFSDPSVAGPADVVLPREILGFEAGIAFASAASLLEESIVACEGALPEDWISRLTAFHDYVRGRATNPPPGIVTGAPYLDENDPSFIFHEILAEQMQALATPALEWATTPESDETPVSVVDFTDWDAAEANHLALAAATEQSPKFEKLFAVPGSDVFVLFSPEGEDICAKVRDSNGKECHDLNGGSIVSHDGEVLGTFAQAQTRIAERKLSFRILLPDGSFIPLTEQV